MKYVIGLGNPGETYTHTRHNVGFLVLSYMQHEYSMSDWKKDSYMNALVSTGEIEGVSYTLIQPQTFMNASGEVVTYLLKKNIPTTDIVVVYDDLAFPFGVVRLSCEKGDGGHNGIKSIAQAMGSEQWLRLRVGIHSYIPDLEIPTLVPLVGVDRADFVLKEFRKDERAQIPQIAKQVVSVLLSIEKEGIAKTMTLCNAR